MVTFSQQATTPSTPVGPTAATKVSRGGNNKLLPLIVAVVVVLVIGGGYLFLKGRGGSEIASGEYHAVFLTNDQVYFGKIVESTSQEVVLKDVYYLLLSQPEQVQPQTPEATPGAQAQPRYILMHLGDRETHGPMDEMRVNRAHILFIEPMREDSKVIRGISDYKQAQRERQQQPQE